MSLRPPFARLSVLISAVAWAAAFGLCTPVALAVQSSASVPAFHSARATSASATASPDGPSWNELSPSQRKVLTPLSSDWNGLDGRSKERWLDVAGRFHKLPPEEQQRANQRMVEWSHMSVAQRTEARLNFQESRGVSKEERQARWKAYQALPDEKKLELAKRAAAPASAASATATLARRRKESSLEAVQPKTNVVGTGIAALPPADAAPVAAAPVHPGATTPLLTRRATPPAHQRDGQPKIAAGPNYVDRTTLLPRRGPQATLGAPASSAVPPHP